MGVGQGAGREVVWQCSYSLEGSHVVVVEVGRRDQVDRVEGLVEAVRMLVEVRVDVSQSSRLIQGGGCAGGTGLFESK